MIYMVRQNSGANCMPLIYDKEKEEVFFNYDLVPVDGTATPLEDFKEGEFINILSFFILRLLFILRLILMELHQV